MHRVANDRDDASRRLRAEPGEQDFVLHADVLVQLRGQFAKPLIERPPGAAGVLRGLKAMRQSKEVGEIAGVVVMLHPHHRDRMADHGMAAGSQHGEEDLLLLLHVLLKTVQHLVEKVRKSFWRFWMTAMRALNLAGENDQAGQVAPMPVVEAFEDGGDDVASAFRDRSVTRLSRDNHREKATSIRMRMPLAT